MERWNTTTNPCLPFSSRYMADAPIITKQGVWDRVWAPGSSPEKHYLQQNIVPQTPWPQNYAGYDRILCARSSDLWNCLGQPYTTKLQFKLAPRSRQSWIYLNERKTSLIQTPAIAPHIIWTQFKKKMSTFSFSTTRMKKKIQARKQWLKARKVNDACAL